jgi:hypothetical protein
MQMNEAEHAQLNGAAQWPGMGRGPRAYAYPQWIPGRHVPRADMTYSIRIITLRAVGKPPVGGKRPILSSACDVGNCLWGASCSC